jgi:site-specific DNA recombinase
MSMPRSAAIYTRISSDPDGTAQGVERQEQDCRALADELGWTVGEVYVDNDVSAFARKPRPEFERMLTDLGDRHRDAVICYHMDRLTRRNKDLDRFLDAVDEGKVTKVRFVTGSTDLASGDGLLVARIMAAIAEGESATKGRRQKRKNEQKAAMGEPHGGANRPFGYERDGLTLVESEAAIVRELVARFLAGDSLRSLATWLNESGVATVNGKTWLTTTLRAMLRSGRIAGLRERGGQVAGKAKWPPIITERDRERVLHLFETKQLTGRRAPRRYLLSGMLRCGKCGNPLYSAARQTTRRYVCSSGPDHGGCGRLTVVAAPVEGLIADAVLYRLDTPDLADALAGRAARDQRTAALSNDLAADREQLDELTALYARKHITAREWMSARSEIDTRIRAAENQLARASGDQALRSLVGTGAQLRRQWAELNLDRQAATVAAVLDHAVITAGVSGARSLDPARVVPTWRL